jgi:diguanylate cyclase (GGDEF)-like protein
VPLELTVIAITALLAGLLTVAVVVAGAGRRSPIAVEEPGGFSRWRLSPASAHPDHEGERVAGPALRLVWWLSTAIVLLGVGISGSFEEVRGSIFTLGGAAVASALLFHEILPMPPNRVVRIVELATATALVGGLLALTGYASSPFAVLFALIAVAAALAHGPRAGLSAAGLATIAFVTILAIDPGAATYAADDALRLSVGLGTTWLLAFLSVAYAIGDRRRMDRERQRARTDQLTGLYNRSQLFVTLDQEVSRTRRSDRGFCVLMIDLDGLKQLNDSAGHLRGDEVIRAIGAVIRRSIRTVDSAYRYGGDEFVVLLPETDIVGAFVVAEKIRTGAEEVGMALSGDSSTSVSIGLVSHPEDGLSSEELMVAADRAMYQAKRLGKNQISGNPRPRPALITRRSILPDVPPDPRPEPIQVEPGKTTEPPPSPAAQPAASAVAIPLGGGPIVEPAAPGGHGARAQDDSEPDPVDVRRQFATARRSFDPDHQIRRAMDAFLSSTPDQAHRTPDA